MKLNTRADGLRMMDRRLPFVIAHMAVNWLYFIYLKIECAKLLEKKMRKRKDHRQKSYIVMTKVAVMKKSQKNEKPIPVSRLEDPGVRYHSVKALPALKDFTFSAFKKIADEAPFTQSEWAGILHLSERTLQRYAKGDGSFALMNAERALQVAKVLDQGKFTFGSQDAFYSWLKNKPVMLEGSLSLESLTSAEGIQMVLTQLARIQHGILA